MDLETLINSIGQINGWVLIGILAAPPLITWGVGRCHPVGRGEAPPWSYTYTALIYLVCVPGLLSGVLTGYSLFFIRRNLLQVNRLVYFGPIVSMLVTLMVVRRQVDWDRLPGIDRIQALMVLITLSFIIALAVYKMRIWLFFGGSFMTLLVIAAVCFGLLKWAAGKLTGPRQGAAPVGPSPLDSAKKARKDLEKLKKDLKL